MTTASVPKTIAYRDSLGDVREHLKGIGYAAWDWAKQRKAKLEESRIERWNSERLAMIESHGGARYK